MNILVVNDDGIDAAGIHRLAEALSQVGDVYVCAPSAQMSATGHGITIGRLVYTEDVPFAEARRAVSMEGTPADCVKIGIEVFRDLGVEIDMVFSGFNHGMNLGTDTLYSGTVSAAVEGALCGLPSAALSISSNLSFHREPEHFSAAMKLAKRIAGLEAFRAGRRGGRAGAGAGVGALGIDYIKERHTILNVNIPDLPEEGLKGVKVCPLSYRAYDEWFTPATDEAGRGGYKYSGMPLIIGEAQADESDIIANSQGYATITPLRFDLTDYGGLAELRGEWGEDVL